MIDQYIMYSLNRRRSFIRPAYKKVKLLSEEEITEFAETALEERDCESAIFFVYLDGTYQAIFKIVHDEEEIDPEDYEDYEEDEGGNILVTYAICKSERMSDPHFFQKIDGEFHFCCYNLMLEIDDGLFEVCG